MNDGRFTMESDVSFYKNQTFCSGSETNFDENRINNKSTCCNLNLTSPPETAMLDLCQ